MMSNARRGLPNPFYVLLVTASCLFVITTLSWLVSPAVLSKAPEDLAQEEFRGMLALASWIDRRSPLLISLEIGLMILLGVAAMATDHLFTPKPE